jgi:hypothetical protein
MLQFSENTGKLFPCPKKRLPTDGQDGRANGHTG